MLFIRLLGLFYLIFRLVLTERILVDELGFQRRFMSRNLNIFLALAWITDYHAQVFSFIVLVAYPVMILSFITSDIRFFKRYHDKTHFMQVTPHNKHKWLLIERITLHVPLIITGWWMFHKGLQFFFSRNTLFEVALIGTILMYTTWFGLDRRAQDNKYVPHFRDLMTFLVTLSLTLILVYMIKTLP